MFVQIDIKIVESFLELLLKIFYCDYLFSLVFMCIPLKIDFGHETLSMVEINAHLFNVLLVSLSIYIYI